MQKLLGPLANPYGFLRMAVHTSPLSLLSPSFLLRHTPNGVAAGDGHRGPESGLPHPQPLWPELLWQTWEIMVFSCLFAEVRTVT